MVNLKRALEDQEYSLDELYNNNISSKSDIELFKEEDNVVHTLINVKYYKTKDEWRVFENKKEVLIIPASVLNKKQREFLKTINGIRFLIDRWKGGIKSLNGLKRELKNQ
jgi:hypothetical protein